MAFIATILLTNCASAKIRRVNFNSNYNGTSLFGENYGGIPLNPVYKTLAQVVAVSNSSDTIYLEGCSSATQYYAGINLTKRLVIIGEGYYLTYNPKSSASGFETNLDYIKFNAGSDSSQLIGVHITGVSAGNSIQVNTSNITIKRCQTSNAGILLSNNITDIIISQNYLSGSNLNGEAISYSVGTNVNGLYINNNIFKKPLMMPNMNADECRNNVFDFTQIGASPSIVINSNSFKNNIVANNTITLNINNGIISPSIDFNTGAGANQFDYSGTYNNKLEPALATTLFIGGTSPDGQYQLLPPSNTPPNYVGDDGADRGVYGGIVPEFRYTLSGLAPIPVIYDVYTTGVATPQNGLPVTIKARIIK